MAHPVFAGLIAGAVIGAALMSLENSIHVLGVAALTMAVTCGYLAIPFEEHSDGEPIGELRTTVSAGHALLAHAPAAVGAGVIGIILGAILTAAIRERKRA
jgi:4-amino-4-deoxy-L-arabinose transferase-like glycosyltransferase